MRHAFSLTFSYARIAVILKCASKTNRTSFWDTSTRLTTLLQDGWWGRSDLNRRPTGVFRDAPEPRHPCSGPQDLSAFSSGARPHAERGKAYEHLRPLRVIPG